MRTHFFVAAIIGMMLVSSPMVYAEEVLRWEDCLAEAKVHNPELISAVEVINQQKAGKNIAASGLYPQIDATIQATRSVSTTPKSSTGAKTSTKGDSFSYGVSGSQLLFDGLKSQNDVKAAQENVVASQQAYRFTSSEIRLNLRTAFVNLLKAQEMIKVSEDIVRIRKDNFELITLRYQSGLEHKGALLTAEANVASAAFELSQARRTAAFAQRQLSKEMGRPAFKETIVQGDFSIKDAAKEKPDFEAIVKKNPSVLQAAAKRNFTLLNIQSAYGNFAPKISANASADRSGTSWAPRTRGWDMGFSMTMPVFEGGLRFAQLSQAQSAYRQALADERAVEDAAVVSLEQAWAQLQDGMETVGVKQKSLEAAQERSRIAEAQYSTGFITFDNWIIIENDLVSAKKAYLEAQANALHAEASWVQAKGETLEYAQ